MVKKPCVFDGKAVPVFLKDFDEEAGPYTMSFGFDLQPLCESIEEIGLINAPCIARNDKGRMEIITGYRRIMALKQLGWRKATCEDLSSVLESPLKRLLFSFHENRATRPLNPVEKAMALSRLARLIDTQEILKRYMPLLSLPSHEETLRMYLRLAESERAFKQAVADGRISVKTASALMATGSQAAGCLLEPILDLNLNFNQQMQLIDIVMDIANIEKKHASQILKSENIREILKNRHLNKPQKAVKVLKELHSKRSPRRSEAEKRFQSRVGRLALPKGMRIDHPAYFEAPGYRLEVNFRNGTELLEKLSFLLSMPGIQGFGDPLYDQD